MKYKVFYSKNPTFLEDPCLVIEDLARTHVFLCEIEADSLDGVWWAMQGENWSPNGEARELIQARGLCHTSMSIGDVIQAGDEYYQVAFVGFNKVPSRRVSVEQKRMAKRVILDAMEELGPEFWKDGYTPEMVTPGCASLQKVTEIVGLSGLVGVVWAFLDRWGFGGDSELCYLQWVVEGGVRDGPARQFVGVWSLPMPYREYRHNGRALHARGRAQGFVDALVRIRRGRVAPDRHLDVWPHEECHNFTQRYAPDEELD